VQTLARDTRANSARSVGSSLLRISAAKQGLTLVHFSARLEPCLTQENTLHTLNTPYHPFNTGYTIPTRVPYPMQSAQVELRTGRVLAPATKSARASSSSHANSEKGGGGGGWGAPEGEARASPAMWVRRVAMGVGMSVLWVR